MCFKEGTVILSYGFAVGNSVSFQIHVIVERRLLSSCYLTTRKESYSSVERSWSGGKWAGKKELSEGEGPSWLHLTHLLGPFGALSSMHLCLPTAVSMAPVGQERRLFSLESPCQNFSCSSHPFCSRARELELKASCGPTFSGL